jgi:hypothetical protein
VTIRSGWRWFALAVATVLVGGCTTPQQVPDGAQAPRQRAERAADADPSPQPSPAASARPDTRQSPPAATAGPPRLRRTSTPAEIAQILTTAEQSVRNPGVAGQSLAKAASTQQRAYRLLAPRPRLAKRVVARLPAGLRPTARRNIAAGAALATLVTPQPKLPDWRIIEPAPARVLLRHYRRAAATFGLEWQYLAAINLVETRMGRIRGRSTAGAQGPMQFMPQTWAAYGRGDINDEGDAIEAAARYLADHGAPSDMDAALWHYNHSDRYVEAVSAYADVMRSDPRAFRGYYHWQVYYVTTDGPVLLPVGYGS